MEQARMSNDNANINALVSPMELLKDLRSVKMLDASYGLPASNVRIGNAVDFDIDDVADPDAVYAHTLPSAELFAEKVAAMGISNKDRVVVYDRMGMAMAAARVWWMFRVFGHENVQVLDGGLSAWVRAGLPLESKTEDLPTPGAFTAAFRPELFKTGDAILANISAPAFTVVDARDAKRYAGDVPEPRPGVESGHIPGSVNVPFNNLIDPTSGAFRQGASLKEALAAVDAAKPVAVSCGSGVTACVIALGLYQLGHKDAAIYGGSWAEWGGNPALPRVKGSAP